MRTGDRAKIREAILQGVYEENLSISVPQSPPHPTVFKAGLRLMGRALSVLILTILLVGALIVSDPISQQSINPVAFSEMASTLPWAEIIQEEAGTDDAGQRSSFVAERLPVPVVAFDAHRLLDYNLLLNHEQARLSSVFGLDVQTIVVDPGHGGKDSGAVGSEGTKEKDIVLDIALHLRDRLLESGRFRVLLTRETDVFMSLADRVKYANENRADLFVSLHINALPQEQYNVTETFYFGPPSDEYTLRLAEQENRGSELLTGDFKNMIKKISDVLKEQESATLAATVQQSLFSNLEKYDRVIADNGIKIAPFVVLLGVDAPSVLVEVSCITKQEEEANLNNPVYREKITASLEQGISVYLRQRHAQVVKGEEENGKEIRDNKS